MDDLFRDAPSSELNSPGPVGPKRNVVVGIGRKRWIRMARESTPKKVALVAAMRKLLATLNSIAKHRSRWNPMLHDT